MKPWPLITLLLFAGPAMLRGQVPDELEHKGVSALADGLWEIAEMHFKECLQGRTLAPEVKSRVAIRLAEALVREGNAAEALELLDQSFLSRHPETPFWKAQALAGQGHYNEACELLSSLLETPGAPHRVEAGLTRASLQLALGLTEEALTTLGDLVAGADDATVLKIRLYQVEILLDLTRTAEARKTMPPLETVPAAEKSLARLLDARILMDEGHPADARLRLEDLLTQPQGFSLIDYHSAAIFLADAIHALGSPEEASKSLLGFIQKYPDSPLLEAMFSRITQWLPEKPTATDPVLERVAAWIPVPLVQSVHWLDTTPPANGSAAISAWPVEPVLPAPSNLVAYSLFTRAIGLHRIGTEASRTEADRLLLRLRLENPGHLLFDRSLFQQARWRLGENDVDEAFALLEIVRNRTDSPTLRGEAAFLEARTAYLQGSPEKATSLFEDAAKSLSGQQARLASLQAAIARLYSEAPKGTTLIQQTGAPADKSLETDLQLERVLAASPAAAKRAAADEFLSRFPDHPRAPELRLAAAEAALSGPQPDLSYARAQLATLDSMPESLGKLPPASIAAARLRILDLSTDPTTIQAAQAVIDAYPGSPQAAEAAFTLGRNLFQAGNYNQARVALEKLAPNDTDKARSQAAWLLAARCAALVGTPESRDVAIDLFDNAIQSGGALTSIAILEKARHLIDLYRRPEAVAFLEKWIAKLPANDPLQLPAGLLLGEALFAEGSTDPQSPEKALAVYDKLLSQAREHPALLDRLQYLRGMTLERLPDKNDPTKTREKEAFQAYHSVLETETPPPEWQYFERCGFRALSLLEKAGRWQAAITVARKIASFKGPLAEKAAARASEIQLEQMIYDDP